MVTRVLPVLATKHTPACSCSSRSAVGVVALLVLGALGLGCELVLPRSVGLGLGSACARDDECHAGACVEGRCASPCAGGDEPCPEGSVCTARGLCEAPLRVGFLWPGEPWAESASRAHEEGRMQAAAERPYLVSDVRTGVELATSAVAATGELVSAGAEIIVAASSELSSTMTTLAGDRPDVTFLVCGGRDVGDNLASYYGRAYQATYVAGFVAARSSSTGRVGVLASRVTPSVVRHVNAFARGARRASSGVTVEVRWLGFWHDPLPPNPAGERAERTLTLDLVSSGCDVIFHQVDTQIPVATLQEVGGARSIAWGLPGACDAGPTSCLGAAYLRWGPLYSRLVDELARGSFSGGFVDEPLTLDAEQSVVGFALNPALASSALELEVDELLEDLAAPGGIGLPLRGPYCSTGQRDRDEDGVPDCVEPGEVLSDDELRGMCWFAEGIVERADPDDPTSADLPALVPDEGDCAP
jgi:basic membrane protein A